MAFEFKVIDLPSPNGHHQLPPLFVGDGVGPGLTTDVDLLELLVLNLNVVLLEKIEVGLLFVVVSIVVKVVGDDEVVETVADEPKVEVEVGDDLKSHHPEAEEVSIEQSMRLHLSLQSLKHMSVQFIVPVGQLQSQRS